MESFQDRHRNTCSRNPSDPADIRALGISAQGETLILVDADGKPLRRAIVWLDNRAQTEADELGGTSATSLPTRSPGR